MYVQGRYAYIVLNSGVLQVIDVSNPFAPVSVSSLTLNFASNDSVYVQGKYAYVGGNANAIVVIDVSNPALPVQVGSVTTTGVGPGNLYVQGRYPYATTFTGHTFEIFDVSNPVAPTQVSSTSTGNTNQVYMYKVDMLMSLLRLQIRLIFMIYQIQHHHH